MLRPPSQCPCEFHQRDASPGLPAPVLFQHSEPEHSFWLWFVSPKPKMCIVAILRDPSGRPYPRAFRGFLEACTFVCKFYNIPIKLDDLRTLSCAGVIKRPDGSRQRALEADLRQEAYPILPDDFGQSALCYECKNKTYFLMPPVIRKRGRGAKALLPIPPPSPRRTSDDDSRHSYPPGTLGGHEVEVGRIVSSFPVWNEEVVHELLYWGATPKLVEVNHTYRSKDSVRAVCTFAHPGGRLVRNIVVPVGLLKLEYPELTEHLP